MTQELIHPLVLPENVFLKVKAYWVSYDTDGESHTHGPHKLIAIRKDSSIDFIGKKVNSANRRIGGILKFKELKGV